jgi:LPXTG-motif cell wall-anchored protein
MNTLVVLVGIILLILGVLGIWLGRKKSNAEARPREAIA